MNSLRIFLLFALFSISLSHEPFNSHLLPRPLILEYPQESSEEIQLECTSWRFGVEANNLGPWKTIPVACAEYVKDYMTGRAYEIDLERVANEAAIYARTVELSADGNDVWVFDVDETLLSNLPYYAEHGWLPRNLLSFCWKDSGVCGRWRHALGAMAATVRCHLEVFDEMEFAKWVEKATAPAIGSSLKLYEVVQSLGFKTFLLTGRSENQRSVTVENLINAGFQNWDKLILR
ncbi:Acid phosphatase 1 [Vitis vinifera]|uniref:Acid phosphatase 1 n=1 Tax=Vitis vinifera TaxID=29760 RepID=A0A438DCB1_VITVI|nr:Acid phosphatase 1 [Vitis vinifera]